jgi:hypothetical protein
MESGRIDKTTVDYVCVSSDLVGCVKSLEIVEERLGSDHKPMVLHLEGLSADKTGATKLREVWRVENIPHWTDWKRREKFVGAFREAFEQWVADAREEVAAQERPGGKTREEVAEKMEKSFQAKLDAVAERLIGKKLVGPRSSPVLSRTLNKLNARRKESEEQLRKAMNNQLCSAEARKEAVRKYREAKTAYFQEAGDTRRRKELQVFKQIEKDQGDSKLFWAGFKGISGGLKKSVVPPPMATEKGVVETDPQKVLGVWKRFSEAIARGTPAESEMYDEDHRIRVEAQLRVLNRHQRHQEGLDNPFTEQEVFLALRKMQNGKAPGIDGVLSSILKAAADAVGTSKLKSGNSVVQALVTLFNFVFDSETWPTRWSSGTIFPLYKQDGRLEPGNYRPITLLSTIGKVFGSVVEGRLSEWSERTLAMADEQGGFRKNRGTPDLLFILRETILMRKAQGLPTLATFVDARKAYDTVWREGNFVKLYNMGVRGKLWRQLQVMGSAPRSKVRLPFGETEWFRVSRGVAQGAVESPWLYSCFVNGLAEELKKKGLGIKVGGVRTPLLMYADDVVMLAGTITELREMNQVASEYARTNRFAHNCKKSAVMLFNAGPELRRRAIEEEWQLSGKEVEVKGEYKYLGIELLQNANWGEYIKKIIAKATWISNDLAWLVRRDSGMRARSACTLWRALVRPKLEYAAELWGGDLTQAQAREMEKIQTDFCRTVLGIHGVQRVANDVVRAELGMERLQARWAKLRLGYWRRIQEATPDRMLHRLAGLRREQLALDRAFWEKGWMSGTRAMLERYGLGRFWDTPHLCTLESKRIWKERVARAVEHHEEEARKSRAADMTSASSHRYYRVKEWGPIPKSRAVFSGEGGRIGALVHEKYLDDHDEPAGRKLKMLCRAGCLPVLDRVGQELAWPTQLRTCLMCRGGDVETIQHLVVRCQAYQGHREAMWRSVRRTGLDLDGLSPEEQCDVALGKSTGKAKIDDAVDLHFKRFIKKAWRSRGRVTRAVHEVVGRKGGLWELARWVLD